MAAFDEFLKGFSRGTTPSTKELEQAEQAITDFCSNVQKEVKRQQKAALMSTIVAGIFAGSPSQVVNPGPAITQASKIADDILEAAG